MINNNDRQQLEKIVETNPELSSLISKIIESYKFNICQFSHELRNPITLINSSLQIIESQHPEVKTFKFWNETMADLQYVRSLLDELSTYNQSTTLNMSEFSIRELMDSICCSARSDTSCIIHCNYSTSLPLVIGDAVKLRQVITNLIKNAKDAVSSNNGLIDVSIKSLDSDQILITVTDNGCGISTQHQATVFEPFVTHKANGSGLGLAICQSIIEAHHGTISLESQVNVGTTFSIVLPIAQNNC